MQLNRKSFLKISGAASVGSMLTGKLTGSEMPSLQQPSAKQLKSIYLQAYKKHPQRFNMCGYAAPKIDTVRVMAICDEFSVDMDVYDVASWSVIGPLSEWSVANRSTPIDIPDFTNGAWELNQPYDISLQQVGTTNVRVWMGSNSVQKNTFVILGANLIWKNMAMTKCQQAAITPTI
ncbi:hypothetical protein [Proteiniphilum sp. UBA5463]|uniref:hypothetical protein n=1 Tax=Proteiniphilum sp. UBA5463 TaxID=1947281 RepID=UPI00257F908F|nr:hypothetical protein [Proteiniphilum sp. UBA5463]